jgi:hypothetical protein
VLDRREASIAEERQSRKDPMTEADVRRLLRSVSRVVIARGASSRRIASADAKPDDLRGPSGGFRAPMVKRGKTLLVGFNGEALEELLRN